MLARRAGSISLPLEGLEGDLFPFGVQGAIPDEYPAEVPPSFPGNLLPPFPRGRRLVLATLVRMRDVDAMIAGVGFRAHATIHQVM